MIYKIENGKLSLSVDSLGAQPVSLMGSDGFEYMWTGDEKYWTGHAPVLFPIVGALRNGRALIDGKEISMGQHGFARRREFALAAREGESIAFVLTSDDETRAMYPFDFALTVRYTLTESGYRTEFEVKNTGDRTMPFAIGGHPGFNIPVNEEAAFEDYSIVFEKPETQKCPGIDMSQALIDPSTVNFTIDDTDEIPLRHELFHRDALILESFNSRRIGIVNKKTGHGVEMSFDNFPLFGIWSAKNDGPYVCLEPWTGCATRTDESDVFEEKHGMIFLPAGGTETRAFDISLF